MYINIKYNINTSKMFPNNIFTKNVSFILIKYYLKNILSNKVRHAPAHVIQYSSVPTERLIIISYN